MVIPHDAGVDHQVKFVSHNQSFDSLLKPQSKSLGCYCVRMSNKKRAVEEDSVDDEVIGPLPVVEEQPVKKKQKGCYVLLRSCALFRNLMFCILVLQFEKMYLENIPSAVMYEKSFMHRDVITQVLVTRLGKLRR